MQQLFIPRSRLSTFHCTTSYYRYILSCMHVEKGQTIKSVSVIPFRICVVQYNLHDFIALFQSMPLGLCL